jgi:hypothetical protein
MVIAFFNRTSLPAGLIKVSNYPETDNLPGLILIMASEQ